MTSQQCSSSSSAMINLQRSFPSRNSRVSLTPNDDAEKEKKIPRAEVTLFQCIEQLSCCEHVLWNLLDGLKTRASHVSFFCREYWTSAASVAQVSLDKYFTATKSEPSAAPHMFRKQVHVSCLLESITVGMLSYYASSTRDIVSSPQLSKRLQQMIYLVHENCLILLDYICTKWAASHDRTVSPTATNGHVPDPKPENLNIDILIRINRYRKVRRGDHLVALRQQNESLINAVKDLTRGSRMKSSPSFTERKSMSAGDKLTRDGVMTPTGQTRPMSSRDSDATKFRSSKPSNSPVEAGRSVPVFDVLTIVSDVISSRSPLEKRKVAALRSQICSVLRFRPLGSGSEQAWDYLHTFDKNEDRSTAEFKSQVVYFEPLPPMLPKLDIGAPSGIVPLLPKLQTPEIYTLVLDLDETLVHYFEVDGQGYYEQRPGCREFLQRMNSLGYEVVVFTAATQDYADWVIDQIDPTPHRLVQYRLYRQDALPWGPIFVKDLRRLGRNLDRTIIIDNVAENFMLQPDNGIFISPWYEDPSDRVLETLTPLLEELLTSRESVPRILDRYKHEIHRLAGHPEEPRPVDECANATYVSWTRDEGSDEVNDHQIASRPRVAGGAVKLPSGQMPHRIAPAFLSPAVSPFSTVLPTRPVFSTQSMRLSPYKTTALQGFPQLSHTLTPMTTVSTQPGSQLCQQVSQRNNPQVHATHQVQPQLSQYNRHSGKQPVQTVSSPVPSAKRHVSAGTLTTTINSVAVPKCAKPTGPSPHGSPVLGMPAGLQCTRPFNNPKNGPVPSR